MHFFEIRDLADRIKANIRKVIVGKEEVLDLLMVALISSGHVLLEDIPGMGKTIMAKALAKSLDCSFKRIQFTPDLLPSDLTGINYYNQKTGDFEFRPGPLFCNILLADEINRATPRTQSSLLECMEEQQVTIDGKTWSLNQPFMVIATQNPVETQGTFPLPEAQLDRFLMRLKMGYPNLEEGLDILKRFKGQNPLAGLEPVALSTELVQAQNSYSSIYIDDELLKYLLAIIEKTRKHPEILLGASPRASQALLRAVQVYAILKGRDFVTPDDIKALVHPVLGHRIIIKNAFGTQEMTVETILNQIVEEVPVPAEDVLIKGSDH